MWVVVADSPDLTVFKGIDLSILGENDLPSTDNGNLCNTSRLYTHFPCRYHFPITSMGTVMVLGGMQAFLSQA